MLVDAETKIWNCIIIISYRNLLHYDFLQEFTEESVEDHAFPTLDEALNTIDQNCGFNIELKWDMILKDGSNECHFPFEINLFLNAVLESVLKHGQRRKIVFSSFNPDICTL